MFSKNDNSDTGLNRKTENDENLEEFFSKVDMKNISLDDARRFSDPDTATKYHQYIAARKEAGVKPEEVAGLMSPEERHANLQGLISKAIEKSGNDNGLSDVLEKMSLFKILPHK